LPAKIVTLTSDFGLKDPYVAEMKAVILNLCPGAVIVDITHGVEKFNVRQGAFILASAAPYFPKGTIHVAVVDPSVGTQRRPIIIETQQSFFVGPDNGLLVLASESQGLKQMRQIESRRLMMPHVSSTFQGRDVFAPASAHLANGEALEEFGPEITDLVKPEFTKVKRDEEFVYGEVLHVDDFGNIITNIQARDLATFTEGAAEVKLSSQQPQQMKFVRAYAEAKPSEPLALIGSHNYLEIALNQGNASARFSAKAGDKITISRR
jgi:S-adenosylmethionine hydrolase